MLRVQRLVVLVVIVGVCVAEKQGVEEKTASIEYRIHFRQYPYLLCVVCVVSSCSLFFSLSLSLSRALSVLGCYVYLTLYI